MGVPQRFAAVQSPSGGSFLAGATAETPNLSGVGDAVGSAFGAYPFIAFKDVFAKMTRVAAKTPFLDAKNVSGSAPWPAEMVR